MSMDVVCVGNATIDTFVMLNNLQNFSYDKFTNSISFSLGEKVALDEYKLTLGGNACNVSVGLARLGMHASLVAEIGSDEFSQKITNTLKAEGVDGSFIKSTLRDTPYFNIILSYGGERTILEEQTPLHQDLEIGNFNSKYVYLTSLNGNWQGLYKKIFDNNSSSKFALNPGTSQISENLSDILEILPKIEVLFVNVSEAQKITNESNPDIKIVMDKFKKLGSNITVVTDGINGSYAMDKAGAVYHIDSATPLPSKERTGAGDAYASGFLYALLRGHSADEAMRYGAINADSVIKKVGAHEGLLGKEEIEQASKAFSNLIAVKI